MPVNSDKPHLWKSDTLQSIDFYNDWFLRFAPTTYREQREIRTKEVSEALKVTDNLRGLSTELLRNNPGILQMLRMTAAPPIARDRLVGLAYTTKNLVFSMEGSEEKPSRIPPRMPRRDIEIHLGRIIEVLRELADRDLFPWLEDPDIEPDEETLIRSASVVADRLCGAAADPIIRNAQEKRQLASIGSFLKSHNYKEILPNQFDNLLEMPPGTYTFRCNILAGAGGNPVNIPIDCVISSFNRKPDELPLLIEAKSAGDATNTNKRRKEEAQKFSQLKQKFSSRVRFVLFLCGYFEPGYLGYEASEGIDWVWEHRISDLLLLLNNTESKTNIEPFKPFKEEAASYTSEFLKLENERFRRQKEIDASKSPIERNRLGQFSTPFSLARQISEYTLSLIQNTSRRRIIEPAVGSGVFISALVSLQLDTLEFVGIELDRSYARISEELFSDFGCDIFTDDFFHFVNNSTDQEKFHVLVTNPPYIRHHHIDSDKKKEYQMLVQSSLDISVSGLAGLYIYYILLADQMLADGAIASWLIPSEFLYVNYGRALRQYLSEKTTIIRIHRFNPEDVQFDDALVSSCIITYKKGNHPPESNFIVTKGTYDKSIKVRQIRQETVNYRDKWNFFDHYDETNNGGTPLDALFNVTRGIATGNNNYFILDEDQIINKKIPAKFVRPMLPGPKYIQDPIIESDINGVPCLTKKRFLLSVTELPDKIKKKYPTLYSYLQEGVEAGVHEGYLCRMRKVWYFQEKRDPPLFLATYMGRNGSDDSSPIRFFLNRSQAIATNVFICLYPKPKLKRLLAENRSREEELIKCLNNISRVSIELVGRSYGGGLHKVEPKELRMLMIEHLPDWLQIDSHEQLEMF